jgi:hypothetical protein
MAGARVAHRRSVRTRIQPQAVYMERASTPASQRAAVHPKRAVSCRGVQRNSSMRVTPDTAAGAGRAISGKLECTGAGALDGKARKIVTPKTAGMTSMTRQASA